MVNVLSRVEGLQSPLRYSRALYEARFADLYPENGLFLQRHRKRNTQGFDCYSDDLQVKHRVASRYNYVHTPIWLHVLKSYHYVLLIACVCKL